MGGWEGQAQRERRSFSEEEGPDGSKIIKVKRAFQERELVTSGWGKDLEEVRTQVMLLFRGGAEEGLEKDVTCGMYLPGVKKCMIRH